MNRVFVIGMETITALGCGLDSHMSNVRRCTSGADYISRFDASAFQTKFGCEVRSNLSDIKKIITSDIKETFIFDRKAELFTCCAALLSDTIQKVSSLVAPERKGVFTGVGTETLSDEYITSFVRLNDQECLDLFHKYNQQLQHINKVVNPSHIITLYAASLFTSTGMRHTNLSACAASTQAIGKAFEAIRSGIIDAAIVGGVDTTINPFVITAFSQLNMISTRNGSPSTASRPFDKTRDGFVPGEGAGVVLLATKEIAEEFGHALGEITGYGSSLDAYKITSPHENGLGAVYAMERCLKSAGWEKSSVEYINAHGTSTPLNDTIECKAVKKVFGDNLKNMLVSSTKSQIGHLIAAAGITEFITTVAAMNKGFLPPSINVEKQDEHCDVTLVTEKNMNKKIKRAISNSFALAGQNATLAFEVV